MKTKKYISQHLGLGDHIITCSIVRHYCSLYDEVVLFCLPNLENTIKSLYKDLKNLEIISIQEEMWTGKNTKIENYIRQNGSIEDMITITNAGSGPVPFDIGFYVTQGFDPSFRFTNFYYERDLEDEEYVYQTLNPNNEKYIFVIDDGSHYTGNNFIIPDNRLPSQYKIIKHDKKISFNDKRFVLFNYYKILENAEEIHMVESAFTHFISSIELKKPKIYIHKYLRNGGSSLTSSKNTFIIL